MRRSDQVPLKQIIFNVHNKELVLKEAEHI